MILYEFKEIWFRDDYIVFIERNNNSFTHNKPRALWFIRKPRIINIIHNARLLYCKLIPIYLYKHIIGKNIYFPDIIQYPKYLNIGMYIYNSYYTTLIQLHIDINKKIIKLSNATFIFCQYNAGRKWLHWGHYNEYILKSYNARRQTLI